MAIARTARATRIPRTLVLLLAMIAGVLALMTFGAGAASADEVDTDKYPYRVSGNVQLNGEPLEGVSLNVSGNGVNTDVVTDVEGQWAVGVPERNADYTVTLDEETLPEGIAVVEEGDDTPNVKEVTVGPGGRVSVNFFIGEGERNVTSFFDQFVQRVDQRLELRPDARARGGRTLARVRHHRHLQLRPLRVGDLRSDHRARSHGT